MQAGLILKARPHGTPPRVALNASGIEEVGHSLRGHESRGTGGLYGSRIFFRPWTHKIDMKQQRRRHRGKLRLNAQAKLKPCRRKGGQLVMAKSKNFLRVGCTQTEMRDVVLVG